jgi:Xaa-Pro aminopeptidase
MIDAGAGMLLLNLLQDRLFDTEIVGEYGESLFGLARETKDAAEIAQMAEAGRLTGVVVGETQEYVRKHSVRDDAIVKAGRRPAHDRRC